MQREVLNGDKSCLWVIFGKAVPSTLEAKMDTNFTKYTSSVLHTVFGTKFAYFSFFHFICTAFTLSSCHGLLVRTIWWRLFLELKFATRPQTTCCRNSKWLNFFSIWCVYFFAMITWLEAVTRLETRWEKWWPDWTRVKFFTEWFDSSHNQWFETRVRVIFTKSLSSWLTNPVRLYTKEWAFFASVMITISATFLFWLSSRAMLPFKDQMSPTCTEVNLRLAFTEVFAGHNIFTPYRNLM